MRSLLTAAAALGTTVLAIAAPVAAHAGTLNWSGDVDDTAVIHVSRDRAWTSTDRGRDVRNERSDMRGFLGTGDDRRGHDNDWRRRRDNDWRGDRVRIARSEGRGNIEILDQPNRGNNYTATVRIRDYQRGSGHYHVVLNW